MQQAGVLGLAINFHFYKVLQANINIIKTNYHYGSMFVFPQVFGISLNADVTLPNTDLYTFTRSKNKRVQSKTCISFVSDYTLKVLDPAFYMLNPAILSIRSTI